MSKVLVRGNVPNKIIIELDGVVAKEIDASKTLYEGVHDLGDDIESWLAAAYAKGAADAVQAAAVEAPKKLSKAPPKGDA